MCTALTYRAGNHFFGRNLDLEYSYEETVTITPRNFPLHFRMTDPLLRHHALIGVAYVQNGYPLYYDAANEKGLAIAGLRFPESAVYHEPREDRINIASFEVIPWLLGQAATVEEAVALLKKVNLVGLDFSNTLPCTPLHWSIADRTRSIVLESCADGLQVHNDPVGVLTNEPPFLQQLEALEENPHMLPGNYSSISRFRKAAFMKKHAESAPEKPIDVCRFFHLLSSVAVPCSHLIPEHPNMITQYTSCCDLDRCIYYYTTYENSAIQAVDLYREDPDGAHLVSYPLLKKGKVHLQNL